MRRAASRTRRNGNCQSVKFSCLDCFRVREAARRIAPPDVGFNPRSQILFAHPLPVRNLASPGFNLTCAFLVHAFS